MPTVPRPLDPRAPVHHRTLRRTVPPPRRIRLAGGSATDEARAKGRLVPTAMIKAVFFDVDFTLIHPARHSGRGIPARLRAHGIAVDPRASIERSPAPRRSSTSTTRRSTTPSSSSTTPRRSSSRWAAAGRRSTTGAREIYDEWAANHHFELYDDVPDVLRSWPARDAHRLDLELAPLPRIVHDALRAAITRQRVSVGRRSTAHEAAPSIFEEALDARRRRRAKR